jgi:hypothetical protein
MSLINISNLAGSELFTDSESFLTDLQATESDNVIGGGSKNKGYGGGSNIVVVGYGGYGGYGGGYYGGGYGGGSYGGRGYGRGYGRGCY